jgi:hypothetical protein
MDELPRHEMRLATTHSSDREEWFCPTCGRRILMHWPPNYQKIVLAPGDRYAYHTGGKGGLRIGSPQINRPEEPALSDEMRAALEKALEDIDFDNPSSPAQS